MNEVIFYIIIALAAGLVAGYYLSKFISAPLKEKIEIVKNWLLFATAQAEAEMGAGTGKLKLAKVYNMFLERFPQLATVIKYEKFCELVDEVLVTLRSLIENNTNIDELINFGEKKV